MKRDKYDDSNPFLWMFIIGFLLFWLMQWNDARPTKLKSPPARYSTNRR